MAIHRINFIGRHSSKSGHCSNASEQRLCPALRKLVHRAAKVRFEPNPAMIILCCARTLREKCRIGKKYRITWWRAKRSFMRTAAAIKFRIHKSPTKSLFVSTAAALAAFTRSHGKSGGAGFDEDTENSQPLIVEFVVRALTASYCDRKNCPFSLSTR